jgi:hypothetical protein
MSTVAHRYHRIVTLATSEDVMSLKTVATEGYSNDEWFNDITEKSL